MDDSLSREPLYQQVAARIRADITAGVYTEKLPRETDLMNTYDVSRDTVRRAIAKLQSEGLISATQGKGTFIRTPPLRLPSTRFQADTREPGLGPWEITCKAAGVSGRTEMIVVERIAADGEVAIGLDVDLGTEVIHRRRHMHAGKPDRVLQIQDGYLPAGMVEGSPLAEPAKCADGIYAALDAIGHPPDTSTETVSARMATPEEAAVFGIRNGVPVIVIRRRTYDENGQIIEWLRVVAAADTNEFVYERLPLR